MSDPSLARKALVLEYFRMWNTGDVSRVEDLLSDDFEYHASVTIEDAATLRESVERAKLQDPDLHVFVDAVLGAKSMVTVVGRIVNSQEGRPSVESAVWQFLVEDRISRIWIHRD